jgi:hypothetical protein
VLSVVLAGLLILSSVTAGIGRTPAVTASGTLNCRDPIGTEDRLAASSKVAGGAVALLTRFPGGRALGAARVSEALLPSHRYWSKTPLYVRTRKAAEIRVPRRARSESYALPTTGVHARLNATGMRRRAGSCSEG